MQQPTRKYSDVDMISKLPLCIIETILCLLPIQEAARTSILSSEWRYHWIKIPKLAFIEDTFQESTDEDEQVEPPYETEPNERREMTKTCKIFSAIYQVLLMHEGPTHEFTLSIDANQTCVEIDHILYHLTRKNSVKKLTLDFTSPYKLPRSLFSFHQLTELHLKYCGFDYQPTFNGFGNLISLYVEGILTSKQMLLHLLAKCPLLKSVTLKIDCSTIECNDDSTIINLFECIPVIENLSIRFDILEGFVQDRVPEKLLTTLVHLKYLCIERICFLHQFGLPFIVVLIRSSPNLEKLKFKILDEYHLNEDDYGSFRLEDCSNIWLEHLNELELFNFSNGENALDFVKLIVAKSPVLKKVRILLDDDVGKDEELQILGALLRSQHASPVVDIIVSQV